MKIQKVKSTDGTGIGKTLGHLTFWFMFGFITTFLVTIIAGLIANDYEQNKDK